MSEAEKMRDRIDQFVDGSLPPEDAAALSQQSQRDAALRDELIRQARVELSLRRLFPLPDGNRADEILKLAARRHAAGDGATLRRRGLFFSLPRYAQAACVLVAAGIAGTAGYYAYVGSQPVVVLAPEPPKLRPLLAAYEDRVASGFKHDFQCANELEFAASVWRKTDQALLLPSDLPSDVKLLGWARCPCMSVGTLMLLTRVEGRDVALFFDHQGNADRAGAISDPALHLHRRDFGPAVIYELSPFDKPRVLELLYDPGFPDEKLKSVGGW